MLSVVEQQELRIKNQGARCNGLDLRSEVLGVMVGSGGDDGQEEIKLGLREDCDRTVRVVSKIWRD